MDILEPKGTVDAGLRIFFAAVFFIWNLFEGSKLASPYAPGLVRLYSYPLWRLALVALVFSAALWCPRVGILLALAVFFYLEDLEVFTRPRSLS